MAKDRTKDLTQGTPWKVIAGFSLPVIGGNLFQLFYTLADSMIVGRTLGADALAAVGATATIVYFVLCFIQGLTGGCGILLGQAFGAGNEKQVRESVSASVWISALFTIVLTVLCCSMVHPILRMLNTPVDIYDRTYTYLFIIFLGNGATVFYNMISNILRALGDSRTPLYFLIFSSLLNVVLDVVFIVPFGMDVAGAAWATVLAQAISAALCIVFALKRFTILHFSAREWWFSAEAAWRHLKVGFPMGFQMSVMCIGQLAMQMVVNSLGTAAVAGYTAASKADQLSVLVNNAMMTAISNYVAQNFGAGKRERICQGVRASLIQTETFNVLMCAGIILLRHPIVELFMSNPTKEIYHYSDAYLTIVAPFYVILGLLAVYRTTIQSMQNGWAPFAACMIELVMRISATVGLVGMLGYTSVCIASPMAWFGACALLIPCYYRMMKAWKKDK